MVQSCAFSMSNINFVNVSTISGAPTDANGSMSVNCTGYATPMIRLCLNFGNPAGSAATSRTLAGPSGNTLSSNLFKDATHRTVWGSTATPAYPVNVVDLPVVGGNASTTLTIYGRVFANQIAAVTGSYSLTMGTGDTLLAYAGYSGTAPSCSSLTTLLSRVTFTLTAQVVADCNISAAPLAFPITSFLNNPLQATSTVQVTCVSGVPYAVSLNGSTTPGGSVLMRKLARNGGAATVNYQLYKDAARTQPWGDGTSGTTTNAGTGNGSSTTFTVYGQVPEQSSQPAGQYLGHRHCDRELLSGAPPAAQSRTQSTKYSTRPLIISPTSP
ncbi:Sigma-fimbriae tip adhesin [Candidatus Burkholderia humilis]|nr:Sigma-fimbriae tip adhesin [Candidatus Burkholderia humilis]